MTGTFLTFAHQIPAGLNFSLSGMPYWTSDIAGYGWPFERDTRDPRYQELYARWYQFGTFCPVFRTHGHRSNNTNEVFSYGPVTPILINYDKLRYRLMPYIYSLAWRVTNEDYTMQRPLVMDWRTNETVRDIGDQFMFGPALLVNPVTIEGAKSRRSICLRRQHGTTSGPERNSQAINASTLLLLSIAYRCTFAPDRSFPWGRRSNTPPRSRRRLLN